MFLFTYLVRLLFICICFSIVRRVLILLPTRAVVLLGDSYCSLPNMNVDCEAFSGWFANIFDGKYNIDNEIMSKSSLRIKELCVISHASPQLNARPTSKVFRSDWQTGPGPWPHFKSRYRSDVDVNDDAQSRTGMSLVPIDFGTGWKGRETVSF